MLKFVIFFIIIFTNAFAKIPIYAPDDGEIEIWIPSDFDGMIDENPEEYKKEYLVCMAKEHSVIKEREYCIEYYTLIFYSEKDVYKRNPLTYFLIDKLNFEVNSFPIKVKTGELIGYKKSTI